MTWLIAIAAFIAGIIVGAVGIVWLSKFLGSSK
jgi:uncharacterized membrane-anchored protein YhcB (DUF1043 family)